MVIEISKAIERREQEIDRLQKLRPAIDVLISDALRAERGESCKSNAQFNDLKDFVEAELYCLGLARSVPRNENGIGGRVGIPAHWSQVKVD